MRNSIIDWQDFITRALMIVLGFLGVVLFFSAFRFISLFDTLTRIGLGAVLVFFALFTLTVLQKEKSEMDE